MHRKAKLINCIGISTLTVRSVSSVSNPIDLVHIERRITHQEQEAKNPTFNICEKLGDFCGRSWKKIKSLWSRLQICRNSSPISVRKTSKRHFSVADCLAHCSCSKEFLSIFPCQIKTLEEEEGQGGAGIGKPMRRAVQHHIWDLVTLEHWGLWQALKDLMADRLILKVHITNVPSWIQIPQDNISC